MNQVPDTISHPDRPMESYHDVQRALSRPLDTARSVEDTVSGFMSAWMAGDFTRMLDFCLLGWIEANYVRLPDGNPDQYPDGLLKSMYRNRKVNEYEILGTVLAVHNFELLDPNVVIDVRVRLNWSAMVEKKFPVAGKKQRKKEYMYREFDTIALFRCIRESGPRTPSAAGEWSISPTSTLREAK